MAGSREATPFEGAGDGYPACAGVRGRQEAAELVRSAILAGRPDDLIFLYDRGYTAHTSHAGYRGAAGNWFHRVVNVPPLALRVK